MNKHPSSLSFASPSPIRSLAPWNFISTTEANVGRLLYDSFLAARTDSNQQDLGAVQYS